MSEPTTEKEIHVSTKIEKPFDSSGEKTISGAIEESQRKINSRKEKKKDGRGRPPGSKNKKFDSPDIDKTILKKSIGSFLKVVDDQFSRKIFKLALLASFDLQTKKGDREFANSVVDENKITSEEVNEISSLATDVMVKYQLAAKFSSEIFLLVIGGSYVYRQISVCSSLSTAIKTKAAQEKKKNGEHKAQAN